jgi:RNA polymerase sigma factor (sigma-70 family)
MPELQDIELLARYARENSEEAFAALVGRHVNLVYSVALRSAGNSHSAEEITQAVFIILARKAKSFSRQTILTGWLHQTARLTAANFLRTEIRRQNREQEAFMQSALNETDPETWTQIAPLLDDAISNLNERDRNAILLRYFENKSAREMAAALRVDEPAAQKRVTRAVEKLRKFFAKRGVTLTAAAIAGAVSANSVQAAPVGLAATVTAAAAKGAAVSASTLTLIKGALKIMAWTKMKMAIVVGAAAILAIGTTIVALKEINVRSTYYKGRPLNDWLKDLDDQNPGPANDAAADAVRHIGKNGLPIIISSLQSKNPLHHGAVLACQILGPDAKPAIPALMKLLNSGYARGYVGAAFGRIGSDAITPVIEALTNGNPEVRWELVVSLGNMPIYLGTNGLQASGVIPALTDCLKDKTPIVRSLAARALGQRKVDETTVVPALVESLNDPDFQTRWSACLALGQFGTRATSAIPPLLDALHDRRAEVRGTAAIALVQIEPDNAAQIDSLMPVLIENIEGIGIGKDINFRSTTATALSLCGEKAKRVVPALLKAVQNTSGYEQQEILDALKKIDPDAAASTGLK